LKKLWVLDKDSVFQQYEAILIPLSGKGVITIAYVRVDDNEPLEKSIKKFKRMVEKEGIIREWKKREYFEKPSTIENRKKKALLRKQLKKVRKMHSMKSY
jgi:small subunit ribosomal protein S21